MKRRATKFEQIPVELAKALAKEIHAIDRGQGPWSEGAERSESDFIPNTSPMRRCSPARKAQEGNAGADKSYRWNDVDRDASLRRKRYAMQEQESQALPQWKTLYESAILELDRNKLLQRITDAERAVIDRMEELRRSRYDGTEHLALSNALTVLHDLRNMARDGNDGAAD